MRMALLALMAGSAASAMAAMPAAAGGSAYCIKGCDYGGSVGDCSFASYQQCQATAAGRDAWCAANPFFSARAEMPPDRSHQSKRRF
jgi:hypothetical protein